MGTRLGREEILRKLSLLSEWLRVKYPKEKFELAVAGGAAMALKGFKAQTQDIDLWKPENLPQSLQQGIEYVAKIERLSREWMNTGVAHMFRKVSRSVILPDYFSEIGEIIEIGENLRVHVMGRQALISMKLYAAAPSYRKHTDDIKGLRPGHEEIVEAVRFVLSLDDHQMRRDDVQIVLKDVGYDFREIIKEIER